jgi:hypothetical protein
MSGLLGPRGTFQEKPGLELPDGVTELAYDHLALRGRICGLSPVQSDFADNGRADANDRNRAAPADDDRLERAIESDLDGVDGRQLACVIIWHLWEPKRTA